MLVVNEKRFAEIKLEALRRQLNPHFTFNAINSLQYFILKNETDLALDYLSRLSNLIRNTLDNSAKENISLSDEISYIRSYFNIENARVNHKVKLIIDIGEKLDTQSSHIPPMLIQPFIENAFLHAFPACHSNPILRVSFDLLKGNLLLCKINDNGKGFNTDKISCGINLIREFLLLTPDRVPDPLELTSNLNVGTEVKLTIKIQKI